MSWVDEEVRMFCPECCAEYRAEFSRCSDCDVALVDRLLDIREADSVSAAMVLRLPKLWVGYVIAVPCLATAMAATPESGLAALSGLLGISGWLYWLYCVYKFHDVMDRIPGYNHPITPNRAVAMHFIPFYNLYWPFKWAREIATFVNWRMQSNAMSGGVVGLLVLLAVLLSKILDPVLGLLLVFTAGVYISHRIRKALAAPAVPASAMARPVSGPLGL